MVLFVLAVVVMVLGKLALPKLVCPSCTLSLDTDIVRFCPECGAEDLVIKGDEKYFLNWPQCRVCGKELAQKRGGRRAYLTRFCTRCGASLDEQGLKY